MNYEQDRQEIFQLIFQPKASCLFSFPPHCPNCHVPCTSPSYFLFLLQADLFYTSFSWGLFHYAFFYVSYRIEENIGLKKMRFRQKKVRKKAVSQSLLVLPASNDAPMYVSNKIHTHTSVFLKCVGALRSNNSHLKWLIYYSNRLHFEFGVQALSSSLPTNKMHIETDE